jgi:hypothetical protein
VEFGGRKKRPSDVRTSRVKPISRTINRLVFAFGIGFFVIANPLGGQIEIRSPRSPPRWARTNAPSGWRCIN